MKKTMCLLGLLLLSSCGSYSAIDQCTVELNYWKGQECDEKDHARKPVKITPPSEPENPGTEPENPPTDPEDPVDEPEEEPPEECHGGPQDCGGEPPPHELPH